MDIVKFAQKNGLKGAKGGWKEFLDCHDKKFGAGLSDPAKRSSDILAAFLGTFTQEKDFMVLNPQLNALLILFSYYLSTQLFS